MSREALNSCDAGSLKRRNILVEYENSRAAERQSGRAAERKTKKALKDAKNKWTEEQPKEIKDNINRHNISMKMLYKVKTENFITKLEKFLEDGMKIALM